MLDRLRSLRLKGRRKREGGTESREERIETSGLGNIPLANTRVSSATRAEYAEGIKSRYAPRATPAAPSAALPFQAVPRIHEAQLGGLPAAPNVGVPIVIPAPATSPLFDEILGLLRESRRAQSALIDQQRESLRYMRRLDERMSRGVRDRDDDLQRLAADIEALSNELRNELGRLGLLRGDQQIYIRRDQAGRRSRRRRT